MSYRPYPRVERVRKYAVLHGKRMVVVNLAPFVASGDFPQDEERMRRLVDGLPSGTIEFSGWFPSGPRSNGDR